MPETTKDAKGNWCSSVFVGLSTLLGSGNTNRIKGSYNDVLLIGNKNQNNLNGNKNLIAACGTYNTNISQGNRNRIGLEGAKVMHNPDGRIEDAIIYLWKVDPAWAKSNQGLMSSNQQTGNRAYVERTWLEQIQGICKGHLRADYEW